MQKGKVITYGKKQTSLTVGVMRYGFTDISKLSQCWREKKDKDFQDSSWANLIAIGAIKMRWKNILQSYSNQDSMGLAQTQKYRSMEQDRRPRDKPTHIWSPYL